MREHPPPFKPCTRPLTGAWCGLKLVGPTLGNFQYGLAFTNNRTQLPDEVVNAINVFVAQSVDSGERVRGRCGRCGDAPRVVSGRKIAAAAFAAGLSTALR